MGFVDDDSETDAETDVMAFGANEEVIATNGTKGPFLKDSYKARPSSSRTLGSPTIKDAGILNPARFRRKGFSESEEIWNELQDDATSGHLPSSRRRSTARSPAYTEHSSQANWIDEIPNESTALLTRAGTGRSYRDQRRRRSTHLTESYENRWKRRSVSSQEAMGGWWKMKRWWNGDGAKRNNHNKIISSGYEDGNGARSDDGV